MIDQKTLESLYRKIPELQDCRVIMLPYHYWLKLSDLEFMVLYTLPNLQIKVNPKTMAYIEARRQELKLDKAYSRVEK